MNNKAGIIPALLFSSANPACEAKAAGKQPAAAASNRLAGQCTSDASAD